MTNARDKIYKNHKQNFLKAVDFQSIDKGRRLNKYQNSGYFIYIYIFCFVFQVHKIVSLTFFCLTYFTYFFEIYFALFFYICSFYYFFS